ncbi:MAG: hypothetical protein ASARMPRED_003227 [Alectoria sarmentosa]|nr:MAG: hypothetical protein ASARMPRED_003227 [Alectoria sarmentosa]
MHPQLFLLALVAPLALSLPQPVLQGDTDALIARQGSGNSTGGGEWGGHPKGKHHGPPPGAPHPERALVDRQGSGNSTGGGPPHPERALVNRQDSGNSTGGGEGGDHGGKHHGGWHPEGPHPGRDLVERQEPGNSTSGGEPHGKGEHHYEGHPGPKVDKRIEEPNGTTGGDTGKEKFKTDGPHGGSQKPGEHKRSASPVTLEHDMVGEFRKAVTDVSVDVAVM